MKRKLRFLIVGAALAFVFCVVLVIPYRAPVSMHKITPQTESVSLSELQADSRIVFDQSMMLVNTEYVLQDGYTPIISEYKESGVYMSDCMHSAYAALSGAVYAETGDKLYVSSHFRTTEKQEQLYTEDPTIAALPGASEHQTGLCLDVYVSGYAGNSFIRCKAGKFVQKQAYRFGFIVRYPFYGEDATGIRYEPWHIRYVGLPHAEIICRNRLTLEEYITDMKIGTWYEVNGYLIARQKPSEDGTLSLPKEFKGAVISPDNTGCYIITVSKR